MRLTMHGFTVDSVDYTGEGWLCRYSDRSMPSTPQGIFEVSAGYTFNSMVSELRAHLLAARKHVEQRHISHG